MPSPEQIDRQKQVMSRLMDDLTWLFRKAIAQGLSWDQASSCAYAAHIFVEEDRTRLEQGRTAIGTAVKLEKHPDCVCGKGEGACPRHAHFHFWDWNKE